MPILSEVEAVERLMAAIFDRRITCRPFITLKDRRTCGLAETMHEILSTLPPVTPVRGGKVPPDGLKKVIQLRFGLLDGRARTYYEIGQELHISREQARQLALKALRLLRYPARSKRLELFLQ